MMSRFLPAVLLCSVLLAPAAADPLGKVLDQENQDNGVSRKALPGVDDLTYLRRVTIDLIGRIPTAEEIQNFESLAPSTRQQKTVERLLADERFADRWTIFFADMLRLRSNAEGGGASIAFIHRAVRDGMGWDEMSRRMIAASGKAGATPELGYILGDNADPMALAGSTAQVFLGVRVACAQCQIIPSTSGSGRISTDSPPISARPDACSLSSPTPSIRPRPNRRPCCGRPRALRTGLSGSRWSRRSRSNWTRPTAKPTDRSPEGAPAKQAQLAAAKTKSNQKGTRGLRRCWRGRHQGRPPLLGEEKPMTWAWPTRPSGMPRS
ncbi:MAG: hypothetical protein CM1200mP2_32670 [Planctomycetaceae bacterium]|nr:MAG: hypothetical protein CM1200mP2_32670 [Planctomycetaceae bacterium]